MGTNIHNVFKDMPLKVPQYLKFLQMNVRLKKYQGLRT